MRAGRLLARFVSDDDRRRAGDGRRRRPGALLGRGDRPSARPYAVREHRGHRRPQEAPRAGASHVAASTPAIHLPTSCWPWLPVASCRAALCAGWHDSACHTACRSSTPALERELLEGRRRRRRRVALRPDSTAHRMRGRRSMLRRSPRSRYPASPGCDMLSRNKVVRERSGSITSRARRSAERWCGDHPTTAATRPGTRRSTWVLQSTAGAARPATFLGVRLSRTRILLVPRQYSPERLAAACCAAAEPVRQIEVELVSEERLSARTTAVLFEKPLVPRRDRAEVEPQRSAETRGRRDLARRARATVRLRRRHGGGAPLGMSGGGGAGGFMASGRCARIPDAPISASDTVGVALFEQTSYGKSVYLSAIANAVPTCR